MSDAIFDAIFMLLSAVLTAITVAPVAYGFGKIAGRRQMADARRADFKLFKTPKDKTTLSLITGGKAKVYEFKK